MFAMFAVTSSWERKNAKKNLKIISSRLHLRSFYLATFCCWRPIKYWCLKIFPRILHCDWDGREEKTLLNNINNGIRFICFIYWHFFKPQLEWEGENMHSTGISISTNNRFSPGLFQSLISISHHHVALHLVILTVQTFPREIRSSEAHATKAC